MTKTESRYLEFKNWIHIEPNRVSYKYESEPEDTKECRAASFYKRGEPAVLKAKSAFRFSLCLHE
ncbi:hypothetical protein HUJ04_012017 [Dendroctonus ponderosae]|nr:hypothetical protein HUJ04_012017 [Dendroctonus ponderosae]